MCRNIRRLDNFAPPAKKQEIHDAAVQYVRKVTGSTHPSQANEREFERAVAAVTGATERVLKQWVSHAPPRNREAEAAKARARFAKRFPDAAKA